MIKRFFEGVILQRHQILKTRLEEDESDDELEIENEEIHYNLSEEKLIDIIDNTENY